jgi:hypothetical protein
MKSGNNKKDVAPLGVSSVNLSFFEFSFQKRVVSNKNTWGLVVVQLH